MKSDFQISILRGRLNISQWVWILFFITLPAGRPFTTYSLILLAAVSLFCIRKNFTEGIKQNMKCIWPLILFYFFHLTGLLYTDNIDFAGKDLSVKLPMVLLPLLGTLSGFTDSVRNKAALAFSFSCVVMNLLLLIRALINYRTGIPDAFFYNTYSSHLHPAYMALMNVIAIAALIFDDSSRFRKKKIVTAFSLILLSVSVILLASKAGIISMLVVYLTLIIKTFYSENRLVMILFSAGVIIAAVGILWTSPARERIKQSLEVFRQPEKAATLQEGTAGRLLAWKTAWHISKDYFPLGTGTGDIKQVTLNYYEKYGYSWPLYYQLNAHNQFLQSLAAVGLGGLVSLIFIILIPIIRFNKEKILLYIFLLLLLLNLLFESMLEVQNGVMLITAFYTLWAVAPSPMHSNV